MSYSWDWSSVLSAEARSFMLMGLWYTLLVSILCLFFGNIVGMGAALLRLSGRQPFSGISYVYTEFFRNTPALVQLIWIFYVVPVLFGLYLGAIQAGVIALSLNAGSYLAEIFRGGIQGVSAGQRDAAVVLGLGRLVTFFHIVLPQAIRSMLPAMGNVFIGLVKDSSLLSVIAVAELTYQAQQLSTRTFRPLETYTLLAVSYFVITYPLSIAIVRYEKRLRRGVTRQRG